MPIRGRGKSSSAIYTSQKDSTKCCPVDSFDVAADSSYLRSCIRYTVACWSTTVGTPSCAESSLNVVRNAHKFYRTQQGYGKYVSCRECMSKYFANGYPNLVCLSTFKDVELAAIPVLKARVNAQDQELKEEVSGREQDNHLRDGEIATLKAKVSSCVRWASTQKRSFLRSGHHTIRP